jgi:PIN domain nuclease of toxin-antitoxin system
LRLLLDTHVWLHSLVDPARLGRRARAAMRRAGNELWISPISVWELLLLAERGRVRLDDEPQRWVAAALASSPVQEAAITFQVAIRSREIMPAHPDPVDRFLVATALVYGLTLVTADDSLIKAKLCPVLASR